jgi:F-type H+-transporting ATPase subunit b
MLEPNPGLIIWTIVTFVLLLIVLRKFAWKPLLTALHDRESSIRGTLEHAENAKAEAERILEENRKQLAKAGEEAQKILAEGRALGDRLRSEIVEQANQASRRMVDQARLEIERDKESAIAQLRGEVAALAIQAAEKILNETLDAQKHRALIDDSISKLPKN